MYIIIIIIILMIIKSNCYYMNLKNIERMPILYAKTTKINIEHIYPKSYLYKEHYHEIHNIYAASSKYNSLRSNYKFDIGNGNETINHKKKIFIPRKEDRGIIARSILFMKIHYNYSINNVALNEDLLYNWNKKYKPCKKEIFHNIYGNKIQGYYNPLITNYKY